ncbi:MAG: leucine-rich repeat protein [Treponematales bacterium]
MGSPFRGGAVKSVTLPASLRKINHGAFWASGLEVAEFNEGLEEIGSWVFSDGNPNGNNNI